jgi:hypothetical protein
MILVGETDRKRPLRRHRHRWENIMKRNVEEIQWEVVDWVKLVLNRDKWKALVKKIMNLWVPYMWAI